MKSLMAIKKLNQESWLNINPSLSSLKKAA
jgi:hypothetical protein